MEQAPLIIGIDPGTTLGYAVINTDGELISIESSKDLSLSLLISKIINLGKIIAVGTDKKNIPSFIREFSAKIGARVIAPKEDIRVAEKQKLTENFNTKDYHQMDALASALFVHKELKPLLKRIQDYAEKNKKESIKNRIAELVIAKELNIKDAFELIEKPEKKESQVIKKVIEEKKLDEKDFLRLYSRLNSYEKENYLLKKQRDHLINEIKSIKDKYNYLLENINKLKTDKKSQELINFKEKRIHSFGREIKNKEYEIAQLHNEIRRLYFFISDLNNNYVVKKLDNLGYAEFEKKGMLLNIQNNDILMVNDPNVINERIIEQIKDKVHIIIHKTDISKKTKELPFLFINSKRLRVIEDKYFALVNKKDLNREKSQINLLDKVVKDYKKERAILADKNY